jgi:hypothetical protein
MAYVDPSKVVSPKANWTLIKVLRNGETHGKGDDDAALAIGNWDELDGEGPYPVFAMRWNGSKKSETGVGNPQSRGLPTWFIVPYWMNDAILNSGLIPDGEKPLVAALLGN